MAEPNRERRARHLRAVGGALLLGAIATACGSGLTQPSAVPSALPVPTPTPTPAPPKAVVISIDGLRPDALSETNTPSILALAARGAYTFAAQTVFPSTTLPSHASMLTGVEPSAHGITFDEYRQAFTLSARTVFALARAAGRRVVVVVGKDKLRQLAVADTTDSFVLATRGDDDVVNEAIVLLPLGFDLLFVHLPQVDLTGHDAGWMSEAYAAQLRQTDAAVGRLLTQLPPSSNVILTADHGGQARDHGTREACDMTIPWIAAGPRVQHKGVLTRPVRTVDTALTVLSLLGLQAPANVAGKPVNEALGLQ